MSASQPVHHIIHDTDRDGWGSAALLLAELGAANCTLHPQSDKDVLKTIRTLPSEGHVWVLDLPAPASWSLLPERGVTCR